MYVTASINTVVIPDGLFIGWTSFKGEVLLYPEINLIHFIYTTFQLYNILKHIYCLGACTAGTYGLDCSYTCHCGTANCDDITGCSGNCEEEWSGPKCNKGNIALKKTAYQSSFYNGYTSYRPDFAVDGDLTQGWYAANCILTGYSQSYSWWEVDLQRDYYIHNVVVHFRTDYTVRKTGVQVYSSLRENQSNAGHWCGNTSFSSPVITTLTCDDTARYITLYRSAGDRVMDFCEVEVFVCDAGTFGENCNMFCHCLNGPCDYVTGQCTGGCKPNWTGDTCNVKTVSQDIAWDHQRVTALDDVTTDVQQDGFKQIARQNVPRVCMDKDVAVPV
ncbi:multiple epidermal growth factor-like domains protein 10 [Gigantopelta aegis]|uniref:multiple epidermal growth factor-like domains protein 10 n=1 Tax=Gigantopelta aegis TaxID=1735272 RepID=UPI001B888B50|nr:multiple epidermal growth factor-like domains protein 10 [Gigantopelta aegis]